MDIENRIWGKQQKQMNEEILKSAKFYLLQYSERIADDLITIKENQENNRKVASQKRMDENYRKEVLIRIDLADGKIMTRQSKLKDIEKIVKEIDGHLK
jgi:hypothetical protein